MTTTKWGDVACKPIIDAWVKAAKPTTPCKDTKACNAAIKCFPGNVDAASGAGALTTTAACELVDTLYGYKDWVDKTTVKCTDPLTLKISTGFANCVQVAGKWEVRTSYTNPDQARFRTIGEVVGAAAQPAQPAKPATPAVAAKAEVKA